MARADSSRRGFLASGGISVALMCRPSWAQETLAPLVIGVLTDRSGLGASVSGPPLVEAVRMAVDDAGSLPDKRNVSVVTAEFQLKADDALAISRRWFDQGVSATVDVPGSVAAAAVQSLARSRGRSSLITGSVNPDLTGAGCSPLGSCWAVDSTSLARAVVGSLMRMGSKNWFLVVPDSVLGLAIQSDAVKAIEAFGGRLVGASRHPVEATDYGSVVEQIKHAGADTIGLCDINQALVRQFGQLQDAGLMTGDRQSVAFLPSIVDIHEARPTACQNLLLVSSFYWSQNEQARQFATRFLAATGQMPDAAHAAAYVAIRHYLRAVAVTESLDADLINQEMRRTPVYFFGRSGRLRLDGRLAIDLSLLRIKPSEKMLGEWDYYESIGTIPATGVYPSLSQSGCAIAL